MSLRKARAIWWCSAPFIEGEAASPKTKSHLRGARIPGKTGQGGKAAATDPPIGALGVIVKSKAAPGQTEAAQQDDLARVFAVSKSKGTRPAKQARRRRQGDRYVMVVDLEPRDGVGPDVTVEVEFELRPCKGGFRIELSQQTIDHASAVAYLAGEEARFPQGHPRHLISLEGIAAAAAIVAAEPTSVFRAELHYVIANAALMIVRGYEGPRTVRKLLDQLGRGLHAGRTVGGRMWDTVVAACLHRAKIDTSDPVAIVSGARQLGDAAKAMHAELGEVVPRGAPPNEPRKIFFEHLATIALDHGADGELRLPPHDSGRDPVSTAFFLFARAALQLLIARVESCVYCADIPQDQRAEILGRLAEFRLGRGALIQHLETARETILAEAKS
jgi:hypothetical protein